MKVEENATVEVGQFALFRWSNAPIPVFIDDVFWLGVSAKSTNEGQSLRTNDSTALCEVNVTISDDGGFPERIDVQKFLWGKLVWLALVEFDLVGHL